MLGAYIQIATERNGNSHPVMIGVRIKAPQRGDLYVDRVVFLINTAL